MDEGKDRKERWYTEERKETWADCCAWVKETTEKGCGPFYFRGHSNAAYPILSTLDRHFEQEAELWEQPLYGKKRFEFELLTMREFMRGCATYLDVTQIPKPRDYLAWLSLMRHHGVPSRLIDFTYSFYVAAYFVLEAKSGKEPKDVAVWIVKRPWLEEKFQKIWEDEGGKGVPNFHTPDTFREFFRTPKPGREELPEPGLNPCVAPVKPLRLNDRLTAQQGLFLCPRNLTMTFDKNLRATGDTRQNIFKLVLAPKMRVDAMKDLRSMNITSATLFPDLDGFAGSLKDLFDLQILYNLRDIMETIDSEFL